MFEEATINAPTAYVIINHSHLHALSCLVYQCISYQTAQRVVLEDIYINMNMMAGLCNISQQFRKEGVAICHDIYPVILKRQSHILIYKKVDKWLLAFRYMEVVLFHKAQHGSFGEFVHLALTDYALFAMVNTKKQVEDDTNHRHESYDQHPCHRFGRLTVIH